MAHFHICHPGHNCDRDNQEANYYDIGTFVPFVKQVTDLFVVNVRVIQGV